MTDSISINQFRTQVQPLDTKLDAKVKLDSKGGLKTFGTGFKGKLSCWFQKSKIRKQESTDIRKSFIDSMKKEFGTNEFTKNISSGIRGDKRLSLRTVKQTLRQLDEYRNTFEPQARELATQLLGTEDIQKKLGDMGFEIPMKEGSPDLEQLQGMIDEIKKDLAQIGSHEINQMTTNKAKEAIKRYVALDMPIRTVEGAGKLLAHVNPAKLGDQTVDRIFNHFIKQEGGVEKLQQCAIGQLKHELETATPETYLRRNSMVSKLSTKLLLHLAKSQNTEFTEKLKTQDPENFPPHKIPNPDFDTTKSEHQETNPRVIVNPEFEKLAMKTAQSTLDEVTDSWSKGLPQEAKNFLTQIRNTASAYENIGKNPGNKIVTSLLGLRFLTPLLARLDIMSDINKQKVDIRKSGHPDSEENKQKMDSLTAKRQAILDVSKAIQLLANANCSDDLDNFLKNRVTDNHNVKYMLSFVSKNLDPYQNMVDSLSIPPPSKEK